MDELVHKMTTQFRCQPFGFVVYRAWLVNKMTATAFPFNQCDFLPTCRGRHDGNEWQPKQSGEPMFERSRWVVDSSLRYSDIPHSTGSGNFNKWVSALVGIRFNNLDRGTYPVPCGDTTPINGSHYRTLIGKPNLCFRRHAVELAVVGDDFDESPVQQPILR